ncbi:MAG: glycine--tRNA ligase subunit beta [Burkholderiales bacterium]|nr:glycine--tRNA ligase subunit beta [Burkholderiales bacterium]
MVTNHSLLVELFVEELPPKSLNDLGVSFAGRLHESLKAQGLALEEGVRISFASPRRLAVRISHVLPNAADKPVSQKLMPVSVGLDAEGRATPALLKRLSALGADAAAVPQLKRAMDGKSEALFFDSVAIGATLAEGLQKALTDAIAKLPIAKVMTYQLGDGWSSVNFVRPAHGLVALHGPDIVPVTALGLASGRETRGHRFEAASPILEIRNADSYEVQMEKEGAVIPSFDKRRKEIKEQLAKAAAEVGGGAKPVEDAALLDEVTALVERPKVLVGKFDPEFLEVPQECLILTMKANQKYFPLLDASGKLTNKFLIVSNIRPIDASLVIQGNERVVRPRLADAKFFYDQDRKKPLDSRITGLSRVVYHNRLGSLGDRIERVQAIARIIGHRLGGEELALQADQAALLSKADLLTDMVGEFPELQGIMGRYYAQHDGLSDEIAHAIEDHYKPRFAGDELPRNTVGLVVALADKLETLVGMFGIGQIPTGDKDPYALRRHALGVIRMLMENDLQLSLDTLISSTAGVFRDVEAFESGRAVVETEDFISDRLVGTLRDIGYSAQEVDAVLSLRPQRLSDIPKRLAAVHAFAELPEAETLAAANKRVSNILRKAGGAVDGEIDASLLNEPAEQALHQALGLIAPKADEAFFSGEYALSLQILAALRNPVDEFFDNVMVNAEDPALRANRLALLSRLHSAMNRVADLSRLAS